jgi:hypothetical protein
MSTNNKCRKCNARVAQGKNYCTSHYQEELANYKIALAEYEQAMQKWESYSSEEKQQAHDEAEQKSVTAYAAAGGAIAGGAFWYFALRKNYADGLYGILCAAAGALSVAIDPKARIRTGRLFRAAAWAPLYFIILALAAWFISIFSQIIDKNLFYILIAIAVLSVLFSIYNEATGGHHASAKPTRPSVPTP